MDWWGKHMQHLTSTWTSSLLMSSTRWVQWLQAALLQSCPHSKENLSHSSWRYLFLASISRPGCKKNTEHKDEFVIDHPTLHTAIWWLRVMAVSHTQSPCWQLGWGSVLALLHSQLKMIHCEVAASSRSLRGRRGSCSLSPAAVTPKLHQTQADPAHGSASAVVLTKSLILHPLTSSSEALRDSECTGFLLVRIFLSCMYSN